MPAAQRPRNPAPRKPAPPEVIDPVWLLKAVALCLVAALLCAYATVCLLFYQGEWQLVLHPTRGVDHTPASAHLTYTDVRFDASANGQPQLTGWWIPAENATQQLEFTPRYAAYTVLFLHDGSGSLSDSLPTLGLLHRAGLNVLAVDYRGFGTSDASTHPTDARMSEDAAAALEYLTSTRHIPAAHLIPYGVGLGATLAANLALAHSELPAVILDNPNPDPASTAARSASSRLIPVRLLFGNRFDIATPLATLATPKLLIAGGLNSTASGNPVRLEALFAHAASPRFVVTLPSAGYEGDFQEALSRFLDQHLQTDRPVKE